jgi:glyoxylase I family protein
VVPPVRQGEGRFVGKGNFRFEFGREIRVARGMKFEHFALNVPAARAMADWYVNHLGFRLVRSREDAPFTRFLADETGRVVVELYSNPSAPIPAYAAQHPLVFHFAVVSAEVAADRARLEKAGATLFAEEVLPDGSRLTMLRDPWGVPLQLCQRAQPMPG